MKQLEVVRFVVVDTVVVAGVGIVCLIRTELSVVGIIVVMMVGAIIVVVVAVIGYV